MVHIEAHSHDGTVWFATCNELSREVGRQIDIAVRDTNSRSALQTTGDDLYFGTTMGIYQWLGNDLVRSLEGHVVFPKLRDLNNYIWVGVEGEELFVGSTGH